MLNYSYCEEVDKALKTDYSPHRTLRSCLDPGSSEWSETTMEKRIEVLRKVVEAGNDLQEIFFDYKSTYRQMNKPHVANRLDDGLTELLKYVLSR